MLTSAIAQHLVQVQPRGDQYTVLSPKPKPIMSSCSMRSTSTARSSARQVDQKDQGVMFRRFVASAMPVRHGGCRSTLRLAAAPRRHIAERGKCRGPFRAARSWFPGSPPRPTSAASRLALGQRRPSYALATASAFPQQAGHLPRPINHLFSARDGGAGPSMARQVSLNSGLPGSRQARCCCQASSATSPTAFCGTRRSSSVRPLLPARIAASAAGSTPTSSRPSCARLSRTLASGPS